MGFEDLAESFCGNKELLLGVVLTYFSSPPPVLWLSLGTHALLWGLTHILIRMEFRRFLPQCRLSVRGFWGTGGLEGLMQLSLFFLQKTNNNIIKTNITLEDYLKTEDYLNNSVYTAAVSLHLASSACQVLLFVVCLLHPNDLPLELLPFVARLLSQGSATLPCYTFPDPHQPAEDGKKTLEEKRLKEGGLFTETAPVVSNIISKDSHSNTSHLSPHLSPSLSLSKCLLDVSILNVVLTEIEAPSVVVHAEYKIQMRSEGRPPWIVRRRFRSFVELSRKLEASFPSFIYPELAAVLPRLPPRDLFSDDHFSFQYLERRRRGLESFLKAVVSESAFWTSEVQAFLEVPEDLRPSLSTQRLLRLSELQNPKKYTFPFSNFQPTKGDTSAIEALERSPVAFPVTQTSPPQAATRRWFASVASRSDASEGVVEAGSCVALSASIWRLRICKETKTPFVLHDISCNTKSGVFYSSRRYKQFVQLRQRLRRELCVSLPPLPGRLVSSKRDYLFHEQRRMHLEMWLKQILADGACAKSPTLLHFLGVNGRENESSEEEINDANVSPPKETEKGLSFMISVTAIKQVGDQKILQLLFLKSAEGQKIRHWEIDVTEKQIKALHTELCRCFNAKEIKLVPDFPKKGIRLLAATPESLQGSYELYLGEICRNYQTFLCPALEAFLREPLTSKPLQEESQDESNATKRNQLET